MIRRKRLEDKFSEADRLAIKRFCKHIEDSAEKAINSMSQLTPGKRPEWYAKNIEHWQKLRAAIRWGYAHVFPTGRAKGKSS